MLEYYLWIYSRIEPGLLAFVFAFCGILSLGMLNSILGFYYEIRKYRTGGAWYATSSSSQRIEQQLYRMDCQRKSNAAGLSPDEIEERIAKLERKIRRLRAQKDKVQVK
jgi:cytochrome c-type biogenesis protein CcmH/NrfG